MRLEFLKVEVEESRRHGAKLAAVDPHKREPWWWRGLLEDFWDHGLKASGDRRPDGVVAKGPRAAEILTALIGYPGPPSELVGLLGGAHLLEVKRDRLRVKGVEERYGPAWDEQQKRKDKASKAAETRWNDARSIHQASPEHRHVDAKIEKKKKTKTEREEERRSSATRRDSGQEACWKDMEIDRAIRCAELGIDPGPVLEPPKYCNADLKRAADSLGLADEGECTRWVKLKTLFARFLAGERYGRFDQEGNPKERAFSIDDFLKPGSLQYLKRAHDAGEPYEEAA